MYILDSDLRPTPTGTVGNLWIGGQGLATGYLNQPRLTDERFVADPFAELPDQRIYNTGDLARINHNGQIEIRGRRDNQVKIRGHRIELEEVERALGASESVRQCAVDVRHGVNGDPLLCAYIVLNDGEHPTHSELRSELRQHVPDYMIPQSFVELDELPLTENRKVDRKSLPDPEETDRTSVERVAPRTELEKNIAKLWEDILNVQGVSVTDNFFELGGQSLQVARMAAQFRKAHGHRLSPRAVIFETLEQLAASIDREAS